MTQISQIVSPMDRVLRFDLCHLRHLWMLSLVLAGCAGEPSLERHEFTRLQMGVQARIVIFAPNREAASNAAAEGFAEIARLEQIMSDYRPESELMQLCAKAGEGPVHVSDDLFEILAVALELSKLSKGAFDVTVGPLSVVWREARHRRSLPAESEIEAALSRVGWREVALNADAHTVHLRMPGMSLDLGGIAKGYAADCAVRRLRALGAHRCLVALAGDIAVGEPPPESYGWQIELASRISTGSFNRVLLLSNACVSTSGDTEQFIEIDGIRYSHIIDPRTGLGVTHEMIVTVIAPTGELADALSTGISVIGFSGYELTDEIPQTAIIIETDRSRHSIDRWRILKWEPNRVIRKSVR